MRDIVSLVITKEAKECSWGKVRDAEVGGWWMGRRLVFELPTGSGSGSGSGMRVDCFGIPGKSNI